MIRTNGLSRTEEIRTLKLILYCLEKWFLALFSLYIYFFELYSTYFVEKFIFWMCRLCCKIMISYLCNFLLLILGALSDAIAMFSAQKDRSVSLKAIRLFRVFRPLRLIAKSNNLKVVLDTIIKSFSTIIHVLLFIFLIITLYAITGLELFSGKLSPTSSQALYK